MEIINAILLAFTPAIIAGAGYLSFRAERWFAAKTHLQMEAYHREALHSALATGAQLVLARVRGDVAAEGAARGALLQEIVAYARRSVPEAIDFFKAEMDQLLDMAEAKVAIESAKPQAKAVVLSLGDTAKNQLLTR